MAKSSPVARKPMPPAEKTKSAICFLCLFHGLRVPSIRRLVRKPYTFCDVPVSTFNPAFFSPDAEDTLTQLYGRLFTGKCDCLIDPSVEQVMSSLSRQSHVTQNQRVILHYFGYGCCPPGNDGSLYFFNDSRTKYYSMQVSNFIGNCYAPQMLIFDCNNAGALYKSVLAAKEAKRLDLMALFSCSAGEDLPAAADLPMDLFSMCLLHPYKMARWWHERQFGKIVQLDMSCIDDTKMESLFSAILNAIAVETLERDDYEALFNRDPVVSSLCRGFLLAQKIMSHFGVTCIAIPSITGAESSTLWDFWDTTMDLAMSYPQSVIESVFEMTTMTFTKAPSPSAYPLFCYFLTVNELHVRAASILLNLLDQMDDPKSSTICKSDIWKTILNLDAKRTSVEALLLLAKLIAVCDISPFEQNHPMLFSPSTPPEIMRAGMLALCCSFAKPCSNSFHRLAIECIRAPDECAPFHCLLFGLLEEKAGKFTALPSSSQKFAPLLSSERSGVRASACFAIGFTKAASVIRILMAMFSDKSWVVRNEALIATVRLINSGCCEDITDFCEQILKLVEDPNQFVRNNAREIQSQISRITSQHERSDGGFFVPESQLLKLLVASVRERDFAKVYELDAFRTESL